MKRLKKLNCLVILCLTTSCSWFIPSPAKIEKDSHYEIRFQAPGWKRTDPKQADFAFAEGATGHILLSHSFCNEYQELELKKLALQTFKAMNNFKIISQGYSQYQSRESYDLYGEGYLDGVKVELFLRNYRRDHCYYDFVHIRSKETQRDNIFDKFLSSVVFL